MFNQTNILAVVMCTAFVFICQSNTDPIEKTTLNEVNELNEVDDSLLDFDIGNVLNETSNRKDVNKTNKGQTIPKDVFLNKRIIVKTSSGSVEGKTIRVLGSTIYTFLSIPYAEPPIGHLRFAKPKPMKRWTGIRQTMNFSAMCPQKVIPRRLVPMRYITEEITEDCLTINIWSPDIRPKTLRTVMVWIHGGAFQYNTANLYDTDGRVLSSYGDVVVVSLNYRNGIFGFLNLQTRSAPGNMGLYDQSLALNWIKRNIVNFGGDPNKIVPFGQSAGAMSIGMLMVMNSTKSIFSRAITASGGGLLPGILTSKTAKNSRRFAKLIGCAPNNEYKTNPEKVVQCLRRVPLNQLIDVQAIILNTSQAPFMPTSKGFYKDITLPGDQLFDKNYNKIIFSNMKEMLSGVVPNEGAYLIHASDPLVYRRHTYPVLKTLDETRSAFVNFLSQKLGIPRSTAYLIALIMITGPSKDTPQNNIERVTGAFGDNAITCPTVYMADEISYRNKSVFMYLYNHRSKATKFGQWMGVSHYEDVPFFFGYPLRRSKWFSKEDMDLSRRMIKLYSYFAKSGKVLPQFNQVWPKYNFDDKTYMVLQSNKASTIKNFHYKNCEIFEAAYKLI